MQTYMGSHGTCLSIAHQIEHEGFRTNPGRIGTGAYFWTAVEEEHLHVSTHLAIVWAQRARDKWKVYDGQADKAIAVVQVRAQVKEEETLNLDEPEHHLELRLKLVDFTLDYFKIDDIFKLKRAQFEEVEQHLYGVVETYIQEYEQVLSEMLGQAVTVKLVFKNQNPPVKDALAEIVGNASCFSVRDVKCIIEHDILIPDEKGV